MPESTDSGGWQGARQPRFVLWHPPLRIAFLAAIGVLQRGQGGLQGLLRDRRDRLGLADCRRWSGDRWQRRLDDEFDRIKSDGPGHLEQFRRREPQSGPPNRRINDKYEPAFIEISKSRVRGE